MEHATLLNVFVTVLYKPQKEVVLRNEKRL